MSYITNRFLSHNELATKGYTTRYHPWEIAHTEKLETKTEALNREKYLKSTQGRKFAWNVMRQNFVDQMVMVYNSCPSQSGWQFDPALRYLKMRQLQ
jgi:putative endonuclease